MNIETELTDSLWLGSQTFRSRGGEEKERRPRKVRRGSCIWKEKIMRNGNLPQVPEDLQKLKKTLSDKTKKKIAENNRKFSICKLCR